jgi:DNA repair photolyase
VAIALTEPLSISSQFHFCSLPLRLDSYRGCAFGCDYCFAIQRGGNTSDRRIAPANPHAVEHALSRSCEERPTKSPLIQMLQRRVPIHFGGMSDPFQPAENKWQISRRYLEALSRHRYPVVISTKGALASAPEYRALYRSIGSVVLQFSFSSIYDEVSSRIEPVAARPSTLLRTMEDLARDGFNVTCRWQPYIPHVSGDTRAFVAAVTSAGAKHVAIEHLKIPTERRLRTLSGTDNELLTSAKRQYVLAGAARDGRELVLRASMKRDRVLQVRDACHSHGITFGSADNEFQYLSDSAGCCSGVDQFPGFENIFRYNIGVAVRRCVDTDIHYESIANEWRPTGSIDRYLNSRSRIGKRLAVQGSVQDHIEYKWNNLLASGNPTNYCGVESTIQRSASGFRVYRWDQSLAL